MATADDADPRDSVTNLRIPPHSVEAEQSVLGGLLLDGKAFAKVSEVINDGDFYRWEHRLIYGAVRDLTGAGSEIDVITVFEALQGLGKAEDVGGLAYLNSLAQSVPSATTVLRYAEIVRERSLLRGVIEATDRLQQRAFGRESTLM